MKFDIHGNCSVSRPTRRYNGWTVHNTYALRHGVRIRARCQEELIRMIDLKNQPNLPDLPR